MFVQFKLRLSVSNSGAISGRDARNHSRLNHGPNVRSSNYLTLIISEGANSVVLGGRRGKYAAQASSRLSTMQVFLGRLFAPSCTFARGTRAVYRTNFDYWKRVFNIFKV
jgi:hypothetical protein